MILEFERARGVRVSQGIDPLQDAETSREAGPAWCFFRSGGQPFTMPLDAVVEVISVDRLIRLPLAPPRVLGMFLLRRDLTPVIDLNGFGPEKSSQRAALGMSVLVASTDHHYWGIAIDPGAAEADREAPPASDSEATGAGTGTDSSSHQLQVPGASGWRKRGNLIYLAIDPHAAWQTLRSSIKHWHTQSAAFSPTTVSEST